MKRKLHLTVALIILGAIMFIGTRAAAAQDFRVDGAGLEAIPISYSGPCPGLITFKGKIQATAPGRVKYTYSYSDGGSGPEGYVDFDAPGIRYVETTWRLGDASVLPRYEGWAMLKITSPNAYDSNKANFKLECKQGGSQPQPPPQQPPRQQPQTPPDQQPNTGNGSSFARPNPIGDGTTPQQSLEKTSSEVMAALERFNPNTPDRQRMLDAERAQFEPASNALVEALRSSGVDLDGYLAASRQFAETPADRLSQSDVNRVNQKFGEPMRAAIAKAVGLPGVGTFMQTPMSVPLQPGWPAPGPPNPDDHNGSAPCEPGCETRRFEPPFEGLASEGDLGTRSIRPGEVRELRPMVSSAVIAAPHSRKGSGRSFTVPASARHVSVTVNLGSSWNIGLSGLGYAHVWLQLDMNVTTSGTAVCSAPRLEQDNQWTWAGGILTLTSRSVPNFTRTCTFDRRPGDPTTYAANIFASTDGTFFGASGGSGEYKVVLGPVDVTYCP